MTGEARHVRSIVRIGSVMLAVALVLATVVGAAAQAGFEDDRVMLQGFYWESYRHGHPQRFPALGSKTWYRIVRENAATIREGRFDLIWLPPPSFAGELSAGYNPKDTSGWTTATGLTPSIGRCLRSCSATAWSPSPTS